MIDALLWAVAGSVLTTVALLIFTIRRMWAVGPYQLGPNIADAEPRIRHIIEHVANPDMSEVNLHRAATLNLLGIDESAAVIQMAAVMLEIGRRAGMDTDEVLEFFPSPYVYDEDGKP